jgi:hypothetical protein
LAEVVFDLVEDVFFEGGVNTFRGSKAKASILKVVGDTGVNLTDY